VSIAADGGIDSQSPIRSCLRLARLGLDEQKKVSEGEPLASGLTVSGEVTGEQDSDGPSPNQGTGRAWQAYGANMPDPATLSAIAAITAGFGVAMLFFRPHRELRMEEKGEVTGYRGPTGC
jgi:hypothetical protein